MGYSPPDSKESDTIDQEKGELFSLVRVLF